MNQQISVESNGSASAALHVGTVALWIAVFAAVCAVAVIVGSSDFRTTRTWQLGPETGQGHQEGAARWAAWTLLAGVSALGCLAISAFGLMLAVNSGSGDGRKIGRTFALLARPFLGCAAAISAIT